jgi:hypothetical protein
MDVYLVFDLSQSMVYDTHKPNPWPAGFTGCRSSDWDPYPDVADCVAKYCNWAKDKDPLQFPQCDPLYRIKNAAYFFLSKLDARYDRVGVVSYDQFGVKQIGLYPNATDPKNFDAVRTAIGDLEAFDHQGDPPSNCPNTSPAACNKNTNIGDGIKWAHDNIASEGRLDSIWSIILMTDGRANIGRSCNGCPPNCGACNTLYVDQTEPCPTPEAWATNNAIDTWNRHETVIYTLGYGSIFKTDPDYRNLLINIAKLTDGVKRPPDTPTENFWAVQDETELRAAFQEIAQRIYARLLQ